MSDKDKKPPTPEEIQKEIGDLLKEKFGGEVFAFPLGPSQAEPQEDTPDEEPGAKLFDALRFDLTPAQVKAHLDRFVIGQEEAKKTLAVAVCDHYNHVRKVHGAGAERSIDYAKQNVILAGPTGVGKTYLIRTLAQLIGVPFVKADITKFSETGYVGGDVDDLVRELVRGAGGSVELAEYGIIFLDEIDKIAGASNMIGRDVSGRGVQSGLLKLLEETEVSVRSPTDFTAQLQDMMQMKRGKTTKRTINTRHILFVASGAFNGLKEIVEKRLSERNVGFAAAAPSSVERDADILAQATTRDFVEYGFEPEFIGRLPVRVVLSDLTEEDLYRILTTSEGSIIKQYQENFSGYGIQVAFEPEALRTVAARAMEEKTGARGLMTVLETCLRDFKFHLPGRGVHRLALSVGMLEDPQTELRKLLEDPKSGERAFSLLETRRFAGDFEKRHGVGLDFDESSVLMAATVSAELGLSIPEYLERVFQEHAEGLQKLAAGKIRLPVTPQVLNRPGEAIDACLGAHPAASRI